MPRSRSFRRPCRWNKRGSGRRSTEHRHISWVRPIGLLVPLRGSNSRGGIRRKGLTLHCPRSLLIPSCTRIPIIRSMSCSNVCRRAAESFRWSVEPRPGAWKVSLRATACSTTGGLHSRHGPMPTDKSRRPQLSFTNRPLACHPSVNCGVLTYPLLPPFRPRWSAWGRLSSGERSEPLKLIATSASTFRAARTLAAPALLRAWVTALSTVPEDVRA